MHLFAGLLAEPLDPLLDHLGLADTGRSQRMTDRPSA
jgi:hypothetical protein